MPPYCEMAQVPTSTPLSESCESPLVRRAVTSCCSWSTELLTVAISALRLAISAPTSTPRVTRSHPDSIEEPEAEMAREQAPLALLNSSSGTATVVTAMQAAKNEDFMMRFRDKLRHHAMQEGSHHMMS